MKQILDYFAPKSSLLYSLDPRIKLLALLGFICILFLANNVQTITIVGVFVLWMVIIAKIPLYFYKKNLKSIWLILCLFFLLQLYLNRQGELVLDLIFLKIFSGGLYTALILAARIIFMAITLMIFSITTPLLQLVEALKSLLRPLKFLRLPVNDIVLIISMSLCFIPLLSSEFERIRYAHLARGSMLDDGSLIKKIKAYSAMLVPVLNTAFLRTDEMALAMSSRCYGLSGKIINITKLSIGFRDTVAICSVVLLFILILIFKN